MEVSNDFYRQANEAVSIFDVVGLPHLRGDQPQQVHCPMHDDARKSARIYPETNTMFCFAESKAWDPVAAVAEREGLSMGEAARLILDGRGVVWQEAFSGSSEFRKLLARHNGSLSERDVKTLRLEIHEQALALRDRGVEVDWEGFDRAHLDVDRLRLWASALRDRCMSLVSRERV